MMHLNPSRIVCCFRVRGNLQSEHTSPLVLNISLTINIGVIDVKPSQSERKVDREDRKRGEVEEIKITETLSI